MPDDERLSDTRPHSQGRPGGVVEYQYTRKKIDKIPQIPPNIPKNKLSSFIFIKVDHFSIGFGSLSRYIRQGRGREIARVVIVACHDPPMSNYAYTCVIPKSTNHKFSGYQSYTINTFMYTSPLYPFVPFLMFFYLYKHEPTKFRTI